MTQATLTNVLEQALSALHTAVAGLEWYRDRCPDDVDGSDGEADDEIGTAIVALEAAIAAALPPAAVQVGFKLVPIEPTYDMIEAGCDLDAYEIAKAANTKKYGKVVGASNGDVLRLQYQAMLAAANEGTLTAGKQGGDGVRGKENDDG